MMKDNPEQLELKGLSGKRLTAVFDEPSVTSDFGSLLLREIEDNVGVVRALAGAVSDHRRQSHVRHGSEELCMQRVAQIACGYYDANDCDQLRNDPAFKAVVGRDPVDDAALGSQPTMSRLENSFTIRNLLRMGYAIIDNFTDSYDREPECIVLDMDPTCDRTYGQQEFSFFNSFAGGYCFMPCHIYEGLSGKLIATVLRTGKAPSGEEIVAILKRVVGRLRRAWSETRIIFRADSHHCRYEVLEWLENNGLDYIIAVQANAALDRQVAHMRDGMQKSWETTGREIRRFHSFGYAAGTWNRSRRIIARCLRSKNGSDARYVVTNMEATGAKYLYETVYCGRGKAELMIKEHKLFLGSDRTSCHRKEANQFRLFLHSAAYVLMHALREKALKGTALATAQFDTIRLRLLKIGARTEVKKSLVRFHLPLSYPLKETLHDALGNLKTAFQT